MDPRSPTDPDKIREVASELSHLNSLLIITGAGMSADSGLPTYRGVGGLYNDESTEEGMPIEQALSGSVFQTRPEITWKYLGQIEQSCRGAQINRGHEVLALMERHFERFWILTQNIDGLHAAAGCRNVIEIHGNLYRLSCTACEFRVSLDDYANLPLPPSCQQCGAMMRPQVVLFDEALPEKELSTLYREMQNPFEAVITIGTSSHFPYIVQPVLMAQQTGRLTVEINPVKTRVSDIVDVKLSSPAAATLDELWRQLAGQ
ncbi:MAG: NAD-dependent protein deacylase [Mariniblastus sp.]|nr:NAD-dependent protein deacylase [Mariniblastus sp.]